jgi:hypothetical protein
MFRQGNVELNCGGKPRRKCNRRGARCCKTIPQYQDFGFQPPRLEAVSHYGVEMEGNCNHTTIVL